jgi:thiamine-monophosphate kinase
MDEFEIIDRYFTPRKTGKRVIVGVGDDGAILRPKKNRDLVCVVDSLVSGVHFPDCLSPEDVGFRSVAVNVSDVAAMGGKPRWMTVALTSDEGDPEWLEALANGIRLAGDHYGIDLVGGDITHGKETVIAVQIIGDVERDQAITRSGAKKGDSIFVSGFPGDAAAGLSILQSSKSGGQVWARNDYLVRRFANPDIRVDLGRAIAGTASAAIDLSDGLIADLAKLLEASGVSGVIDVDRIPLSPELQETMSGEDALNFALGGGDDYELCFTASDKSVIGIGEELGIPVTKIGKVKKGGGLSCRKDGEPFEFDSAGYRHF